MGVETELFGLKNRWDGKEFRVIERADGSIAVLAGEKVLVDSGVTPVTAVPSGSGVAFALRESTLIPAVASKLSALGLSLRAFFCDIPGFSKTYGYLTYADGQTVVTAENLFDTFSTARSAPANTYYINGSTGNDTTGDGSSGNPWKSVSKATIAGNATNQPYKVIVANSELNYQKCLIGTGGNSAIPTQDCAIIARGGRVAMGSWVDFSAPSTDATYTNCYSWTANPTAVDRVFDRTRNDKFGKPVEFRNVGTAARCNVTPDSWAIVSNVIYINRGDGLAVTNANTRVLVQNRVSQFTGSAHVFFGGETDADGWDLYGGAATAVLDAGCNATFPTPNATPKIFVAKNVRALLAGRILSTGARGVSFDSFNGAGFFFNCDASGNATDGFNAHNTYGAAGVGLITVNCTGFDNGRGTQQSCNGWTTHENVWGLDVSGHYAENRGGTCRSINTTTSQLAGTYVEHDMGDIPVGGVQQPTAFRVDNTATYYLDGCRARLHAGGFSMVAADSGSAIFARMCQFGALQTAGAGTLSTY